ncbi:MAG: AAA family ATPase, partial [Eubacteriales bacterium]|nr:AAA family ATPase [Eubacteriales bacterium]
ARHYFAYKKSLLPMVLEAYRSLAEENDIIVIEGAGSPAEINLKKDDIVNMGLAKAVGAPVLLVGDIDRGGVFAQLLGTQMLLDPDEQALLKGMIINKFRGDKTILDPGVQMLEERSGVPVVGVVPYMQLDLDDEDSLSPQLDRTNRPPAGKPVEIAVIRLPHLSNFTDFNVFARIPEADLRYVSRPEALCRKVTGGTDTGTAGITAEQTATDPGDTADAGDTVRTAEQSAAIPGVDPSDRTAGETAPAPDPGVPDMIILPGTKNTLGDLRWLKGSGMAAAVRECRRRGSVIFGICGGFQMLGRTISDPFGTEEGGTAEGLGFLEADTVFEKEKKRTQVYGRIGLLPGVLQPLEGMAVEGYEIHMGRTQPEPPRDKMSSTSANGSCADSSCEKEGAEEAPQPFSVVTDRVSGNAAPDGLAAENIYGTYVHGIFDAPGIARGCVRALAGRKGIALYAEGSVGTETPGIMKIKDPGEARKSAAFSGTGQESGLISEMGPQAYKETQYDLLADTLRRHLDMKKIYEILESMA